MSEVKRDSTPQVWKCGEPYHYPIPTPNEDLWNTLLEPQLKEDRIRCEAWKDEVQTLLIFAGLFSAVVTAFVVQSYPTLQEDPSLILLHRLVERVESLSANVTLPPSTSPSGVLPPLSFTPDGSPTRINILWFFSLILSLTTVLFGIIALQWIREHQRYRNSVKSKVALAIFRMRSEALEAWYVPHIFTGLPLLLLVSLVLFFVGIIDFLQSLNRVVATPVTVLIVLTLLFVTVTTCLPTLQLFSLASLTPSGKSSVPSQCPYKSPQSWAFHQLTKWTFKNVYAFYSFLFLQSERLAMWEFSQIPLQLFFNARRGGWISFDLQWLIVRDAHFQFLQGLFTPSVEIAHPRRPKYDITSTIINIMEDHPTDHELVFAAYHCFHEISSDALHQDLIDEADGNHQPPKLKDRNELLRRFYFHKPQCSSDIPISSMIGNPKPALLHDENMVCFLWLLGSHIYSGTKSDAIRMHIFELQSRILAHTFSEAPHPSSDQSSYNKSVWSARICAQYKPFDTRTVFTEYAPRLNRSMVDSLVEQYFLILHSFIQTAASTSDEDIMKTTHGKEIMLLDFLQVPSHLHRYILRGANTRAPEPELAPARATFQSTLSLITSALKTSTESEGIQKQDFLFFCSCILARNYTLSEMLNEGEDSKTVIAFIANLSSYERKLDKERFLALFEPLIPWSIHSFFDDERRRYIFVPLHRMPTWIREAVIARGIITSQREMQLGEHTSRQQLSNFLPIDGPTSASPAI